MLRSLLIFIALNIFTNIYSQQTGSFTDPRDGKTYKTVKIGNQIWMAENLNFETKESWCYDNDIENCKNFGRLYTWVAAKSACPPGWHLPSEYEYKILLQSAGGIGNEAFNSMIDGGKSGFSALFGGSRLGNGKCFGKDFSAEFWSSSTQTGNRALGLHVSILESKACYVNTHTSSCFSVRCLKDNLEN